MFPGSGMISGESYQMRKAPVMNLKFKAEQKPERRSGIRKRRCYLWLLLLPVGIVLFAASCGGNPSASLEHCTPAVPAGDPGPVISVLCYNIQSRPVLDDAAGKNPRIGRKLAQYDFAGIQELFASPGKVFEAADSSIGGGYFGKRRHWFKIVNSGLAVFSKHRIIHAEAEYFEDEGSLENRLGLKGVLMVRCEVNGAPLDFYTTHLAAGTEAVSGKSRRKELQQIIAFIRRHSPEENAVILCGDFNLSEKALGVLSEYGLGNCASELGAGKKNAIDHIYFRSGEKLRLRAESWGFPNEDFQFPNGKALSDHAPIVAVFRLDGE